MQTIYAVLGREDEGDSIIYLTTDKAKAERIKEGCSDDVVIEEYIDGDVSILNEHIFRTIMEIDGTICATEIDAEAKLYFSEQFDDIKEHRNFANCLWLSMYVKADSQDEAELKGYTAFKEYLEK
ncbi:MAG: hypothetical protein IJ285_00860 [Clostridia bacterium]|nr:hypothetical protein [Clostridia bacterium]